MGPTAPSPLQLATWLTAANAMIREANAAWRERCRRRGWECVAELVERDQFHAGVRLRLPADVLPNRRWTARPEQDVAAVFRSSPEVVRAAARQYIHERGECAAAVAEGLKQETWW
jgi:hypothetical protein